MSKVAPAEIRCKRHGFVIGHERPCPTCVTNAQFVPELWRVPKAWVGERCLIIAGGESVKPYRDVIPQVRGRVIAIKQSMVLRPDADVMFLSGQETYELCRDMFPLFRGSHIIARGKSDPRLPPGTKRLARSKDHWHLCEDPSAVSGYDAGTSAINLAYLFGATEILLLGYDMCGGRWFNGEIPHHMPYPPQDHFVRHMAPLPEFAKDCAAKGVRVVNCSPISKVTAFERRPLEDFL